MTVNISFAFAKRLVGVASRREEKRRLCRIELNDRDRLSVSPDRVLRSSHVNINARSIVIFVRVACRSQSSQISTIDKISCCR
jgi:hypothetical protein